METCTYTSNSYVCIKYDIGTKRIEKEMRLDSEYIYIYIGFVPEDNFPTTLLLSKSGKKVVLEIFSRVIAHSIAKSPFNRPPQLDFYSLTFPRDT